MLLRRTAQTFDQREPISELRDHLARVTVPLAPQGTAELNRRYATLDEDIKQGRDAFMVFNDLTARYRRRTTP